MKKSELFFKGSLGFAIIALTLLAAAVTGLYFGVALGRNALREGDISDESELLFDLSEPVSEVPEKLTSASDGSAAFAESFRGNFPCGFAVENFHEKECGGNPDSI